MTRRDTADLIRQLSGEGGGVRRLSAPWVRAATWCALSLPYLALLYWLWPHDGFETPAGRRFAVEQAAALATGITAATAAFATSVPGRSRKLALVPLVPLAVWVSAVGDNCVRDWSATRALPPILAHWGCFGATTVAGIVPAIAMVVMLRRGAPLTPRLTTGLAALAVAGVANFGVAFVHALDASFVVLAWHLAAVFALSALVAPLGEGLFNWRRTIAATRVGI